MANQDRTQERFDEAGARPIAASGSHHFNAAARPRAASRAMGARARLLRGLGLFALVFVVGACDARSAKPVAQAPAASATAAVTATATSRAPATAGDASRGFGNEFDACMARAGSRGDARAACLTAERDRQDARLNKLYRQLVGNLQGPRRDRMVDAQRAWVQLRQKDAAFEASILDDLGPMGNLQSVENDARAIRQRADLLEKYLELSKL